MTGARSHRHSSAASFEAAQKLIENEELVFFYPEGTRGTGKLIAMDVKAGDRVLFGKWSGNEVKLDGEELLIMKESDIMGVLTDLPATKKKAA